MKYKYSRKQIARRLKNLANLTIEDDVKDLLSTVPEKKCEHMFMTDLEEDCRYCSFCGVKEEPTPPQLPDLKQEFIKKFCNDHNGEVRWLRGVAFDNDDLLVQILSFFDRLNILSKRVCKEK